MTFFEQLHPGLVTEIGSHTFAEDEIVRFARKYDPQPFHLSREDAEGSLFGGLCASGWHTAAVFMRLNIRNGRDAMFEAMGYDGPEPVFGPSPGVRDLRWLRPVFVGDTVSYRNTLLEARASKSKPGWGVLSSASEGTNQDGETVITFRSAVLVRMD